MPVLLGEALGDRRLALCADLIVVIFRKSLNHWLSPEMSYYPSDSASWLTSSAFPEHL
jgi:hypothetical protein